MKFHKLTENNKPLPYKPIFIASKEGIVYMGERSKSQVLQNNKTYDFYEVYGPFHSMLSCQIDGWCYAEHINIEIH